MPKTPKLASSKQPLIQPKSAPQNTRSVPRKPALAAKKPEFATKEPDAAGKMLGLAATKAKSAPKQVATSQSSPPPLLPAANRQSDRLFEFLKQEQPSVERPTRTRNLRAIPIWIWPT